MLSVAQALETMDVDRHTMERSSSDPSEIRHDGSAVSTQTQHPQTDLEWLQGSLWEQKSILECLPLGICLVSCGRLRWANRRCCELFGFADCIDVLGRNLSDFLRKNGSKVCMDSLEAELAKNSHIDFGPVDVVQMDGKLTTVNMSIRIVHHSETSMALATLSDFFPSQSTDSLSSLQVVQELPFEVVPDKRDSGSFKNITKNINEVLKHNAHESIELARSIIEQAQDLFFAKDLKLRYTMVNPAMERLHRRSASKIIGRTAYNLHPHATAERIKIMDMKVLQGDTVEEISTTLVHGAPLTFHGIRAPLKDPNGDIVGLFGIVRNITETLKAGESRVPRTKKPYLSKAMQETLADARSVAAADGTVLLLGESGSGKDFLARWIHEHSRRASGPFFSINCAAVSAELAESELFGHEQGAFTGARTAKKGLVQLAEGGTLLLNEIGEFPLSLQAKLLTFLDTKSFFKVGGERDVEVNVRIMAATHRNLVNEVAEGRFLSALFYRLNVLKINVPPLRERRDDILLISREIISVLAKEMQLVRVPTLDRASLDVLKNYHWPGNVRELKNVLERAVMLSKGGSLRIDARSLDSDIESWSHKVSFDSESSFDQTLKEVAIALCNESIRRCGGSKTKAADLLGISRGKLYRTLQLCEDTRDYDT